MKKIREESVKMFVALMFTLLPLYYSDNYYNILNDKKDVYYLFAYILIAAVACSLMISLAVSIYKQHMAAGQCVGYCNDRVCITGCLFNHLFDGYTYIIIRRESLGSWNVDHSCQCIGIFCDFQMLYRKKRYLGVFVSGFLCGTGNWCD